MSKLQRNQKKSHFLYTEAGRQYLLEEFSNKKASTYEIAEKLKTYPNMVRRALTYHGIKLHDRKEAQKNALEKGRAKHPTAGTHRSLETKHKIGSGLSKTWSNFSKEKIEKIKEIRRKAWADMGEEKQKEIKKMAAEAIAKTAKDGSQLEKFLYTALITEGYKVTFHAEKIIDNKKMHVDLFLHMEGIAIEVDGFSHFYPVYGEEKLKKRIEADQRKSGLLLMNGYTVIRICNINRSNSQTQMREFTTELLKVIKELAINPPTKIEDRYIELLYGEHLVEYTGA